MKKILKALEYSSIKHKNQTRKGKELEPYINHIIDVINILRENNIKSNKILISAILHDILEDTDTSYEELKTNFGKKIADIVLECSDDKKLSKSDRKILQITETNKKSKKAQIVKIADKISNLKSIQNSVPKDWGVKRILGYIIWSKAVVDNMNVPKSLNKQFKEVYNKCIEKYKIYFKKKSNQQILKEYILLLKKIG